MQKNIIKSGWATKWVVIGLFVTLLCISSVSAWCPGCAIDEWLWGPPAGNFNETHNGATVNMTEGGWFTVELPYAPDLFTIPAIPIRPAKIWWNLTVSDGLSIWSHWSTYEWVTYGSREYKSHTWMIDAKHSGYQTITGVHTITWDDVDIQRDIYTLNVIVHPRIDSDP